MTELLDRYAVIGNPIEHSKSPLIHAAFAQQTGERLSYDRILGDLVEFEQNVGDFFAHGGRGLNVTLPFKQRAWRLADRLTEQAQLAGAVNTLLPMADGSLLGANTDGIGLVRDLTQNHNCRLSGSKILLLGAGGAARGVAWPLLEQGPERLVIANRTPFKAQSLARLLHDHGSVNGVGLQDLAGQRFDLIINSTSAGLSAEGMPAVPAGILAAGGWVYDLMYGDASAAFIHWGRAQGAAKSVDGLGMLVEQAAESFFLWRGVHPSTSPVIDLLGKGEINS